MVTLPLENKMIKNLGQLFVKFDHNPSVEYWLFELITMAFTSDEICQLDGHDRDGLLFLQYELAQYTRFTRRLWKRLRRIRKEGFEYWRASMTTATKLNEVFDTFDDSAEIENRLKKAFTIALPTPESGPHENLWADMDNFIRELLLHLKVTHDLQREIKKLFEKQENNICPF